MATPARKSGMFCKAPFYWGLAALALLGLGFASYLTYLDFTTAHVLFCTVGTGCDRVRDSQYSTLLGVPVALFGALLYISLVAVSLAPLRDQAKRLGLFGLATLGFTFSAYLTYAELFWIRAICPYCVASAIVMTAIFVAALLRRPTAPAWPAPRIALLGIALAAFTVVGATFIPRELSASPAATPVAPFESAAAATPTPEATATPVPTPAFGGVETPAPAATPTPTPFPWAGLSQEQFRTGLAKHLRSIGALLYYSPTCPHCAQQKALFGDAVQYLYTINCSGPEYLACMNRGISAVPTWEIRDQLYLGVMSLEELAVLSEFKP